MSKENKKEEIFISSSKAKRMARQKALEEKHKKEKITKIVGIAFLIVILAIPLSFAGYKIYRTLTKVVASDDYSKELTSEGLIEGVTASDLLELADYIDIEVPLSEVEYSDEDVEADIQTQLENNETLESDSSLVIEDGDTVNIDYVGTVDGVEFDGGNTDGAGADLEIGSDSYVDGFEDQLIGHSPGEEVSVAVTFPDDYDSTDLAGQDAVFTVTINGIYVLPEFDDEFVQTYLSDYATTADGYRTYLKETNYDTNLQTWIQDYLLENTTVISYPKAYIKQLKALKKYEDQNYYEYMNEMYAAYGYTAYTSFDEYTGMSEAEYDASLEDAVLDSAKESLIYQAIYELENMTVSSDEFTTYFPDYTQDDYDSQVETYGEGFMMQQILSQKVITYLMDTAVVE